MRQAMRTCKARTKREAVEAGLRLQVRTYGQARIKELKEKSIGPAIWKNPEKADFCTATSDHRNHFERWLGLRVVHP
jgi:hypothetical protein